MEYRYESNEAKKRRNDDDDVVLRTSRFGRICRVFSSRDGPSRFHARINLFPRPSYPGGRLRESNSGKIRAVNLAFHRREIRKIPRVLSRFC